MEDRVRYFETHDGLALNYHCWVADVDNPCLIYLHGLESHMGWFTNMAVFLNQQGYNVYAFDRRGSGLNKNQRGHLYSYFHLFNDIKLFLEHIRHYHPKSKVFLMGLCLGGKIAASFFHFYPRCVDALILVSPSIAIRLKIAPLKKLVILFCALFLPKKKFAIPINDCMFTTNKKYLDMIKDDPLRLKYISGRYFLEIAKMDWDLAHVSHEINVPLLVLLAGHDEIIDTQKVSKWHDSVVSTDKSLKLYPDYYHMLLFEENSKEVMQYIADWIKKRSA